MIAAVLLRDSFDAHAMLGPFFSDEVATAIGSGFLKAGRFRNHEPAQRCEHLRETSLQQAQAFFGERGFLHGADMLTMQDQSSNRSHEQQDLRGLSYAHKEPCRGRVRVSPRAGVRI
jgi:hypothetical protein